MITTEIRDGYIAARFGFGAEYSPWPPCTMGALAWDFGYNAGSLPTPFRQAMGIVVDRSPSDRLRRVGRMAAETFLRAASAGGPKAGLR